MNGGRRREETTMSKPLTEMTRTEILAEQDAILASDALDIARLDAIEVELDRRFQATRTFVEDCRDEGTPLTVEQSQALYREG
jgi:hypothetical protein